MLEGKQIECDAQNKRRQLIFDLDAIKLEGPFIAGLVHYDVADALNIPLLACLIEQWFVH